MSLNIGMRFENWVCDSNNYKRLLNNQQVPDFSFIEEDISKIPSENKPAAYKKAVLNVSESRIANYDANNNKKMEFDEYVTEQQKIYEKTFNEKLDLSIAGMKEMLKQIFDNCDTNHDGSIDNKEMAAVFAYMDGNSDDGKLDGHISYKSAMTSNWQHPDMPQVLLNLKNFIFGG